MKAFFLTVLAAGLFAGCKKESESIELESPKDYVNTTTGKYTTYRLDSTVYINFGASAVTRSYQEKHVMDQQLADNLGRPAYRVFRYLRDTLGSKPWQPAGSYYITPLTTTVELVENNLRFLKLATPLKEGFTWIGNRYLPDDAYDYDFNNDNNMKGWEFAYTETAGRAFLGGKSYDSVLTVLQVDEKENAPVTDPAQFGNRNYWLERYAKGLGLIYQETIMWEYQSLSSPRPGFRGFGVKRSIIDHN